jgi:hypothetical protein
VLKNSFRGVSPTKFVRKAFLAKLVPGVDLVPFWTMAVANVYRKSKRIAVTAEESRQQHPALKDPQHS